MNAGQSLIYSDQLLRDPTRALYQKIVHSVTVGATGTCGQYRNGLSILEVRNKRRCNIGAQEWDLLVSNVALYPPRSLRLLLGYDFGLEWNRCPVPDSKSVNAPMSLLGVILAAIGKETPRIPGLVLSACILLRVLGAAVSMWLCDPSGCGVA